MPVRHIESNGNAFGITMPRNANCQIEFIIMLNKFLKSKLYEKTKRSLNEPKTIRVVPREAIIVEYGVSAGVNPSFLHLAKIYSLHLVQGSDNRHQRG